MKAWEKLPERTAASFNELFRLPKGYLADCVGCDGANTDIRPNMIVACGLPYKMLDEQTQLEVIRTVRQHLLTPKGLRSLSPRNPLYKGSQEGTPAERDFAGKNGSVWPWLLSFYVSACFDIDGDAFLPQAEEILAGFEEDIQTYGIGFDRRTVRRRSSVRAARSHFAGVERRGRAGHLRHDPRTQTERDARKVGKTHKKSESEDCEGRKKRW